MRNVLRKISFQKLKITACCEQDCTEKSAHDTIIKKKILRRKDNSFFSLIHNLIGNRFLEKATTSIHWICKGQDRSTLQRTRKFLGQMPKIDKFKLTWETEVLVFEVWFCTDSRSQVKKARALIDDATLLTLLSKTNHLELSCKTECSAQGMMDVFQVRLSKKYVLHDHHFFHFSALLESERTQITFRHTLHQKRSAFPSSLHLRPSISLWIWPEQIYGKREESCHRRSASYLCRLAGEFCGHSLHQLIGGPNMLR